MRNSALVAVTTLLCSCASTGSENVAPPPETVNRMNVSGRFGVEMYNEPGIEARTIPMSIHAVWEVLPTVYQALGIPDGAGDSRSLVYGNGGYRPRRIDGKRLSTYVDCGSGLTAVPNADQYEVTMIILTQLEPVEGSPGTTVKTTVDANARPRTHAGNQIHCQSKGTLEMRVTNQILLTLASRTQ
jgi:hypothetical protein